MREIKFRAWDKENKRMEEVLCNEIQPCFNEDFSIPDGYVVMQFTGLKDKNGKEIYEGDIVKCGNSIVTVEWDEYIDQDFFWGNACGFVFNFDPDKITYPIKYEVIGNIYENKELLN